MDFFWCGWYAWTCDRRESFLGLVIQTDKVRISVLNGQLGYNCRTLQHSIVMYLWQAELSSGCLSVIYFSPDTLPRQ